MFKQFYFLIQTKCFAWAIAFALWPFLAILHCGPFFEINFFSSRFLYRTTLVFVEIFLACFILFFDSN